MKKYLYKFLKYFACILILSITIILCYFNNNYKIFNRTNSLDKSVFKISMYNYSLEQVSTATAFSVHYNIISWNSYNGFYDIVRQKTKIF